MDLSFINKGELLAQLRASLEKDLEAITRSQLEMQAGATHEENRSEGDKDMRATETSYIARGLAQRVVDLRGAVEKLHNMKNRSFGEDEALALSACVVLEDEEEKRSYLYLAPVGGGVKLRAGALVISVVTPDSPLGRELIGKEVGDEIERGPSRFSEIVAIC